MYVFASRYKNGATGLVQPYSGVVAFCRCPAIIYYIYKNIRFVNLYKISRAFLCNIPTCNLAINCYNNKRKEDINKTKKTTEVKNEVNF